MLDVGERLREQRADEAERTKDEAARSRALEERLRIARELGEVAALFEAAVREAKAAFGRGECFVEVYVERGRHP